MYDSIDLKPYRRLGPYIMFTHRVLPFGVWGLVFIRQEIIVIRVNQEKRVNHCVYNQCPARF